MPKFRFPKLSRRTTVALIFVFTLIGFLFSLAWSINGQPRYEPAISTLNQMVALIAIAGSVSEKSQN
jgi:hypothetical protein